MNYLNNPKYNRLVKTLKAKSDKELMNLFSELDTLKFTAEISAFKALICEVLESRISEYSFNKFLDDYNEASAKYNAFFE